MHRKLGRHRNENALRQKRAKAKKLFTPQLTQHTTLRTIPARQPTEQVYRLILTRRYE